KGLRFHQRRPGTPLHPQLLSKAESESGIPCHKRAADGQGPAEVSDPHPRGLQLAAGSGESAELLGGHAIRSGFECYRSELAAFDTQLNKSRCDNGSLSLARSCLTRVSRVLCRGRQPFPTGLNLFPSSRVNLCIPNSAPLRIRE